MPFETGPYVQAACFCNMALEDKTNTLSLIRVIDRVTHTVREESPPDNMPPFRHQMMLVIMLKSGEARGRRTLTVTPELPSGLRENPIIEATVHFGGGANSGQNLIVNLNYEFTIEGLHLFRIYLEEDFLTALPFHVQYNRVTTR